MTKPLNYRFENDEYWAGLAIPNQEVKIVYRGMFRNWLYLAAPSRAYIDDLVAALFSGDAPTIQEILEEVFLRILSYQDGVGRTPEKLYHGLILGLLVHLKHQYDIRSNRESGRGRADVMVRQKTPGKPGASLNSRSCGLTKRRNSR